MAAVIQKNISQTEPTKNLSQLSIVSFVIIAVSALLYYVPSKILSLMHPGKTSYSIPPLLYLLVLAAMIALPIGIVIGIVCLIRGIKSYRKYHDKYSKIAILFALPSILGVGVIIAFFYIVALGLSIG